MRATSTVVDAAICLVFVTLAVATLAGPTPTPSEPSGDDVAETLASTTTTVDYDYGAGDDTVRQRATGTHAGLLGRAAFAELSIDGESLTPWSDDYRREIRNATATVLSWNDRQTRVEAYWRPYPGAPLEGTVAVGPASPPAADVAVTTLRVPVPVAAIDQEQIDSDDGGYQAVAEAVATEVVTVALPGGPVDIGSRTSTTRRVATSRYRAVANATDRSVSRLRSAEDPQAPSDSAIDAIATRLARDLRQQFDSPHAALAALETNSARILVKEWDA